MNRPNPLFRNLNSKIASLPMVFIVLFVFIGGTFWTVAVVFHQRQDTADFHAHGIL